MSYSGSLKDGNSRLVLAILMFDTYDINIHAYKRIHNKIDESHNLLLISLLKPNKGKCVHVRVDTVYSTFWKTGKDCFVPLRLSALLIKPVLFNLHNAKNSATCYSLDYGSQPESWSV